MLLHTYMLLSLQRCTQGSFADPWPVSLRPPLKEVFRVSYSNIEYAKTAFSLSTANSSIRFCLLVPERTPFHPPLASTLSMATGFEVL